MATFKKGDKVAQIVPVIKGEVVKFSVNQESGEVQYLVAWTDAEGQEQSRYFEGHEIDIDPETLDPETTASES